MAVGLGMFSAIAFMPTFLQMSSGLSAANSGLLMLPMTAGIILTIQSSAGFIARTGRYKIFTVAGVAVIIAAMIWMTTLSGATSLWTIGGMFFVLGAGLGLIMQNVVLAAQNAVPADPDRHRDLDEQLLPRGRRHAGRRGLRHAVHQPAGRQPHRRAVGERRAGGRGRASPRPRPWCPRR